MVEIPNQEIAKKIMDDLNENESYRKTAKDWEGAITIEFLSDGNKLKKNYYLWLDLWHEKVRSVEFIGGPSEKPFECYISANETNWRRLFKGELDPTIAMRMGKFKFQGNLDKLRRNTKATTYIFKYLTKYLKDW